VLYKSTEESTGLVKNGWCDDKGVVIKIADNEAGSFKASFGCFLEIL